KPRSAGAWAGDAYASARHISLSGWCNAPDELTLSDALDRLNDAASLDNALLTVTEGGRQRWMMVRREDEVLYRRLDEHWFRWSVQLVATDPRKFAAPLSASTRLPASSGGLTVPFTVPFSIDATMVSGQVSLHNPGNETGPV